MTGIIGLTGFILLIAGSLFAERLPIRSYSTADGLPSNTVFCIVPDSRGFLWFCTSDGLVRFDGYTFGRFHLEDGIPDREVTAFLETRAGAYWVATYNGVARFDPHAAGTSRKLFTAYSIAGPEGSRHVTALVEDRDGAIWCGTRHGAYRMRGGAGFQPVDFGLSAADWKHRFVKGLAVDAQGWVWLGAEEGGLHRRGPDGVLEHYPAPTGTITSLITDHLGRIWAGGAGGVCLFTRRNSEDGFHLARYYRVADGLPNSRVKTLLESADGSLLAGTEGGLAVLSPGAERFRSFTASHGLTDVQIRVLGLDPAGNLWIAAVSCLMRMARSGFLTYSAADGLGSSQIVSILEDREGHLCAVSGIRQLALNRLDGNRFTSVRPRLSPRAIWPRPSAIAPAGYGSAQPRDSPISSRGPGRASSRRRC